MVGDDWISHEVALLYSEGRFHIPNGYDKKSQVQQSVENFEGVNSTPTFDSPIAQTHWKWCFHRTKLCRYKESSGVGPSCPDAKTGTCKFAHKESELRRRCGLCAPPQMTCTWIAMQNMNTTLHSLHRPILHTMQELAGLVRNGKNWICAGDRFNFTGQDPQLY